MGRLSKILSVVSANQVLLVSPLAFGDEVIFSLTELSLWDTQRSQTDNSCSLFCQFLGLVPEEQAHRAHVKVETEVSTLPRDNFLSLMQHDETNSTCSYLTAEEQNRSLPEIISILLGVKCWGITPDAIFPENLSLTDLVPQTLSSTEVHSQCGFCPTQSSIKVTFTNLITEQNRVMKDHFSWKRLRHKYTLWHKYMMLTKAGTVP